MDSVPGLGQDQAGCLTVPAEALHALGRNLQARQFYLMEQLHRRQQQTHLHETCPDRLGFVEKKFLSASALCISHTNIGFVTGRYGAGNVVAGRLVADGPRG